MQLYTSPTTPFGRKVQVALIEAGLADRVAVHGVAGSPIDPGTLPLDRNPLGKIPALVLDDGRTLYDSRVICRYLDAISGGMLYPTGPGLWDSLVLEATADGMLDAAILMVYEVRLRPEAAQFTPWVEGQWAKIARALDAIEARHMSHLAGPLKMDHIAIGCMLAYLDFRHAARDWRAGHPALASWQAIFVARPSMISTQAPVV